MFHLQYHLFQARRAAEADGNLVRSATRWPVTVQEVPQRGAGHTSSFHHCRTNRCGVVTSLHEAPQSNGH